MFSVNNVPCRGHSLSGPWGCEALENSAVMKPLVRKPSPWLLGSMGTVSYRFCRKGSSSWWGLWAPGLSLEALRGTARPPPPQLRYPAPPHSSGHPGLNVIQTHPPSGSGFTGVLFLGYFYLLNAKFKDDCVLCITGLNFKELNPERPILSDLLWVSGGKIHSDPFS